MGKGLVVRWPTTKGLTSGVGPCTSSSFLALRPGPPGPLLSGSCPRPTPSGLLQTSIHGRPMGCHPLGSDHNSPGSGVQPWEPAWPGLRQPPHIIPATATLSLATLFPSTAQTSPPSRPLPALHSLPGADAPGSGNLDESIPSQLMSPPRALYCPSSRTWVTTVVRLLAHLPYFPWKCHRHWSPAKSGPSG